MANGYSLQASRGRILTSTAGTVSNRGVSNRSTRPLQMALVAPSTSASNDAIPSFFFIIRITFCQRQKAQSMSGFLSQSKSV